MAAQEEEEDEEKKRRENKGGIKSRIAKGNKLNIQVYNFIL